MAQSSTPLISYWHPSMTYDFTLRVGQKDYSTDLVRVEIRSSVTTPYQHIFLDIFMDPRDVLSEELFGQQEMKLIIRLKGKLPESLEEVKFNLMYIDTEADYRAGQQSAETDQVERGICRLKTVCIGAYQSMSTMVNAIYFNQTPGQIIRDLVSRTNAVDFNYDISGRSNLKIDQLLIPPTTLYNVVTYLDKTYGIFRGPMAFHATYDNKIKLQNLNKKPNSAQIVTLHLLSTDGDSSSITEAADPKVFYTKKPVINSYKGNAVFSVEAPTIRHIVKPRNSLAQTIETNLETFSSKYGVIEKNNPKVHYNKLAIDNRRIGYDTNQTGYDTDQIFIQSNLSQNISDLASTIATVEGNLPTLNLMAIGEHVKLVSHSNDHIKLGGSYILKGTDIQFVKGTLWESFSRLYMTRTNVASQ